MALTGRAVALLLAGVLIAVWSETSTAVRLWWVIVGCLVALDVVLALAPARLSLLRDPSEPVRLGDAGQTTLVVRNPTRRRARATLRDAWQPSAGADQDRHQLTLPPDSQLAVTTRLVPTRRGDRRADRVTLRVYGPLRLAARQRSFPVAGAIRALPPFPSRRHLPNLLRELRQLDGRSAIRTRGSGTEFDSLRDYVAGDDVRSIDWRATARRSSVAVRTWRPERDRHVVIVLDTCRTSAGRVENIPRLDSAMDACLLLTALASRAGDRVDVLAGDRRVHTAASSARRDELTRSLTTALASVEPALVEADWSVLAGEIGQRARHRALVVLLTALEPSAVQEGLLPVIGTLTRRHLVVLASVQDPALAAMAERVDSPNEVYAAAAAEQTLRRRERTSTVLQRLGVHVIDAPPQELPPALCAHYLALKGRGLL